MSAQQATEAWRGKVGKMSQDEMEAFLAEGVIARLGCLDDEGWPYVVPTWFQYADGGFYIIPRERSVWAKFMQRDPRVFLTIDVSEGLHNRRIGRSAQGPGEGRGRTA